MKSNKKLYEEFSFDSIYKLDSLVETLESSKKKLHETEFSVLSYVESSSENLKRKCNEDSDKNRYLDISPYSNYIVNLKNKEYINASWVKVI